MFDSDDRDEPSESEEVNEDEHDDAVIRLAELCDWGARVCDSMDAVGEAASASGVADSSSSGAAALHSVHDPSPSSTAPPPPAPEVEPEVQREPALGRKKEVTEEVLKVDGYGDIRYNPRTRVFVAHCQCNGHGDCRRQRTAVRSGKHSLQGFAGMGAGRPLGLLCAWLLEQKSFSTRRDHVNSSLVHLRRQKRVEGREHLKKIPGCSFDT